MNDLIVVPQTNQWQKLKALVLDSVSSPITKRVYNLGLDEFFAWFGRGTPARLHEGHRERLAGGAGGPRPRRRSRSTSGLPPSGNWQPRRPTTGYWRRNWPPASPA